MLHEFGHFITAKRAGMKVTEYFVGFGPRLWSVRKGETEYGVKAIPAGGYVRIIGFTSTEEVPEEDEARAYRQQPFHQRIIVASAGSAMHFLIAFVLALILVFTFGQSTNNVKVYALDHWAGRTTPAALAGLKAGDVIVSIDGKTFTDTNTIDRRHRPQHRQAADPRRRARRQAHPPDGDARERQGDQGRRQVLGEPRLPRLRHETYATRSVSALASPGRRHLDDVVGHRPGGRRPRARPSRRAGSTSIFHQVTNSKDAQSAVNNPGLGAAAGLHHRHRQPRARSPSRRAWPRS